MCHTKSILPHGITPPSINALAEREYAEHFAADEFKVLIRDSNFICQRVKVNDDDCPQVE